MKAAIGDLSSQLTRAISDGGGVIHLAIARARTRTEHVDMPARGMFDVFHLCQHMSVKCNKDPSILKVAERVENAIGTVNDYAWFMILNAAGDTEHQTIDVEVK